MKKANDLWRKTVEANDLWRKWRTFCEEMGNFCSRFSAYLHKSFAIKMFKKWDFSHFVPTLETEMGQNFYVLIWYFV